MDQRIIDLYDDFTHRHLDRRLFLERLAKLVGSTAAALALLPQLQSNYALAQTVPEMRTPRLKDRGSHLPGLAGTGAGLRGAASVGRAGAGRRRHPREPGRAPAHQGRRPPRGDRRLRRAGARPACQQSAGTPATEDEALDQVRPDQGARRSPSPTPSSPSTTCVAAPTPLGRSASSASAGAAAWSARSLPRVPTSTRRWSSTAPHRRSTRCQRSGRRSCSTTPGTTVRETPSVPPFEAALKAAGKTYTLYMYEGAQHGFHNDTAGARYDAAAAKLAWARTMEFFDRTLRQDDGGRPSPCVGRDTPYWQRSVPRTCEQLGGAGRRDRLLPLKELEIAGSVPAAAGAFPPAAPISRRHLALLGREVLSLVLDRPGQPTRLGARRSGEERHATTASSLSSPPFSRRSRRVKATTAIAYRSHRRRLRPRGPE